MLKDAMRLSTLCGLAEIEINQILIGSYIIKLADTIFYCNKNKEINFHCNPANLLSYRLIKNGVDLSLINLYEIIKDGNAGNTYHYIIDNFKSIQQHRHNNGHKYEENWSRDYMKEFKKSGRRFLDNVPAQVWHLRQSLNKNLIENGDAPICSDLIITHESADLLCVILNGSLKCDAISRDYIVEYMIDQKRSYELLLEENKTGRDADKEKEWIDKEEKFWRKIKAD